ncbi:hypothetical protein NIES4071_87840 [Calothrix sp. NIES-4071]|nr:hypothetical protein NIES4071_87840 [Calothrix sp. NIES-4071]BAZ63051.1 hypothetical protein NIES4105_87770 [Calothrix sp. NIES-4105]
MRVLLGGIIISLGLSSLPVQAQQPKVSDSQVAAMVEALRQSAPKNTPNDGLYSDWQVKPGTVKLWTNFCLKKELTPTQFENDPATARKVVSCVINRELSKQLKAIPNNETAAVGSVACWWMTGNYTGCNRGFTADFVKNVTKRYQQQRSKPEPQR